MTTAGKSGGGTQGREVKTKSTKKKGGRKDKADSDSEDETSHKPSKVNDLEFMTPEELTEELAKMEKLRDCPEELREEIASQLYRYSMIM